MSSTDQSGFAVQRFIGGCLMAIGGLIAVSCGLCTAAFIISTLRGAFGPGQSVADLGFLILPLMFGGVPTAVGVALVLIGRSIWRGAKPPVDSKPDITFS